MNNFFSQVIPGTEGHEVCRGSSDQLQPAQGGYVGDKEGTTGNENVRESPEPCPAIAATGFRGENGGGPGHLETPVSQFEEILSLK